MGQNRPLTCKDGLRNGPRTIPIAPHRSVPNLCPGRPSVPNLCPTCAQLPLPSPLVTVDELAAFLKVPVKTLYNWRSTGVGPPGIRIGRYVRYQQADIDAWLKGLRA